MRDNRSATARVLWTAPIALALASASAGQTITEIIDATGDGAGNILDYSYTLAVDGFGNVYVNGLESNNAFKVTPQGVITELIQMTGDAANAIAADSSGTVYVSGQQRVFRITPAGSVSTIIDFSGDGAGNSFSGPMDIALDSSGNVYVTGHASDNAFKITPAG